MRNVYCNETATTEIYTLSLHDALPISAPVASVGDVPGVPLRLDLLAAAAPADPLPARARADDLAVVISDRKSTRLNSSHANISYAVFCLKKKNMIYHLSFSASSITSFR